MEKQLWDKVIVNANAYRIIGSATAVHSKQKPPVNGWSMEDTTSELKWNWNMRQGNPIRDQARYIRDSTHWSSWPGYPVTEEDVSFGPRFELEPQLAAPTSAYMQSRMFARIRRMLCVPTQGIIIGKTFKMEGEPVAAYSHSDDYESGYLGGATRRIPLYEVCLEAKKLGRAQITLVHEKDLVWT